ncbi:hypothetical protein CWI38_2492p0010, partial [Hamiltosporidium tvaerminnensis]
NEHNPFILITNSTIIILKGTLGINTHISIRKVNTLQSLTILLLIKQSFITPDFSYGIPTLLTPFNIYLKIYNIEYTTVEYDSVVKGVNNSTYNYNPVNNSSSKQQGVNNSTYNYNPVNNSSSKQQGVNNSTYTYNPVNNSGSKQQGVNNSTYNYNPVNNSSSKQQGVNNSTYNYNPVNNSGSKQDPFNNSTNTNTPTTNTNTPTTNINTLILSNLTLTPSGLQLFITKITPFYYTNTPLRLKVSFIINPQSVTTRITISDCNIKLKIKNINEIQSLVNYTLKEIKKYTFYSIENRISIISLILFDNTIIICKNNGSYFIKVLLNFISITIENEIICKCVIGVLYYDNYLLDYYPLIDQCNINISVINEIISVNSKEVIRGVISDGLLREIRYFNSLGVKNILYNYSCSDMVIRTISKILKVVGNSRGVSSRDSRGEGNSNRDSKEGVSNGDMVDGKQQGVNISISEQQGVSNGDMVDGKQQGVNISTSEQQGVNISTSEQQGVSNRDMVDSKQQGVNDSTNPLHPVNDSTSKQQGVNISSNTTNEQHPLSNTTNNNTPTNTCYFTDNIATLTINNTVLYLPLNKEGTNLYTFNTSLLAIEITLSELKRKINIYNPVIIKNMTEFKITVGLSNNYNDILTPFSNSTIITPFNDSSLLLKGCYLLLQPFGYKQGNKGVNISNINNTPTSIYFTCNDYRAMHMVLIVDVIQYKCSDSNIGFSIGSGDSSMGLGIGSGVSSMGGNNTPLNNSSVNNTPLNKSTVNTPLNNSSGNNTPLNNSSVN